MISTAVRKVRDAFLDLLALITLTGTTGMEFQSSTTLLALAAFAFSPWTNLDGSIPFQRELLSLLRESTWGVLFFTAGAFQSWANIKRHSRARMIAAFIAASVFGYLAILASMVSPISLFLSVFSAACLSQGMCFLVMSLARFRVQKLSSGASLPKVRLDANA